MSKVVVLGNTGMLGHMVQQVLSRQMGVEVQGFGRETFNLKPANLNSIGTRLSSQLGFQTDWVINCLGATKPMFNVSDISIPLYVNAIFPHQLTTWASLLPNQPRVIHITTDCVYDGKIGKYDESAPHTAQDQYGKSKSLGEPDNCMVLRTSIIGPEKNRSRHLLSWIKKQAGKEARGYTNHWWNGVTTLEFAHILANIICGDLFEQGSFHIFSSDVTKHEIVWNINKVYNLDIDLKAFETETVVDRRLRTTKELNGLVNPHSFGEMIKELKEYEEVENG